MYAVGRLSSYISQVSGPFHPFGGAVDIIVVEQQDRSFKSSPWYVKFGKFQGVLKTREKVVNISVNGIDAGFHMYLNHKGEAYFLSEVDADEEEEGGDSSSPPYSNKVDEQPQNGRLVEAQSLNLENNLSNSVALDVSISNKVLAKSDSRRSRIFRLMFGRKSMIKDREESNGGISMERISSLERAEIAAELLEMRWSTNFEVQNQKVTKGSKRCSSDTTLAEAIKYINGRDGEASENENIDYFDEISCSKSDKQVLVAPTLEASDVEDSSGIIYEQSTQETDWIGNGDTASDDKVKQSGFQAILFNSARCSTVCHGDSFHLNAEQLSGNFGSPSNHSVSIEKYGIFCHEMDACSGVVEASNFPGTGHEGVELSTGVLPKTSEFLSEENSEPESLVFVGVESSTGCIQWNSNLSTSNEPCFSSHTKCGNGTEVTSGKYIVKSTDGESPMHHVSETLQEFHPLVDKYLLSSNSIEAKSVEVTQYATVKKLVSEKCLEMVDNFVDDVTCVPHAVVDEDDRTYDSIEAAHRLCSCNHQAHQVENLEEVGKRGKLHLLSEVTVSPKNDGRNSSSVKLLLSSMPSLDSSEDDQFLFSDIENFAPYSAKATELDDHPTQFTEEEHVSNDLFHETSVSSNELLGSHSFSTGASYSEELFQKSPPGAFYVLPRERARSSPICISRGHMQSGEIEPSVGSLPNRRGHAHNLEWSDVLWPLSRSVDVSAGSANWDSLSYDFTSNLKTKLNSEEYSESVKNNSSPDVVAEVVDVQSFEDHKHILSNPAVEISLCKHLLFEGMGADAASQAFDSEKIDLEKFSQGPSVVNDDRLILRIAGHYLPWHAASPIVLETLSFGQEYAFKPEGMIAVEQAEKLPTSELSAAVVSSGGGWRLWPFGFRKSKSLKPTQPPLPSIEGADARNTSESCHDEAINKLMTKKKKIVRLIVPTNEQLTSLNLKEGKNVITFTYSTAMLGSQQVDARIYLWKWNSRVVVSDVDGTITKSDVLGQFMPLVGRDWSQTGVAHLFTAIKENGYQLLFLSARAISQAYLTRQFLFNLKQDGKALPDGPVVISPDGLFPSLFREVIRRAPHEFKIACLEQIRQLFPPESNPFYAGFGNRNTDEISYLKVGIPKGKIFIINPKGEVVVNRRLNTKSYTSLHSLVNDMFPPMVSAEQEEFNTWNYWRLPIPDL